MSDPLGQDNAFDDHAPGEGADDEDPALRGEDPSEVRVRLERGYDAGW